MSHDTVIFCESGYANNFMSQDTIIIFLGQDTVIFLSQRNAIIWRVRYCNYLVLNLVQLLVEWVLQLVCHLWYCIYLVSHLLGEMKRPRNDKKAI